MSMGLCLSLYFRGLDLLSMDLTHIFEMKLQYISDGPVVIIFVNDWEPICSLINE